MTFQEEVVDTSVSSTETAFANVLSQQMETSATVSAAPVPETSGGGTATPTKKVRPTQTLT